MKKEMPISVKDIAALLRMDSATLSPRSKAAGPRPDHPIAQPIGVESMRRLSAVSLGTTGSTTTRGSSLSGLTSMNELVPRNGFI